MNNKQSELIDLIRLYLKNWKLFLVSFVLCVGLAFAYLSVKNPMFKMTANILIKQDSHSGGMSSMAASMMKGVAFGDMLGVGGGVVDDEREIVASYSTLYKTVKDLNLNIRYSYRPFLKKTHYYKDSPLILESENVNLPDTFSAYLKFNVKVNAEGIAKVKVKCDRKTIGKAEAQFPVKVHTKYGDFTLKQTAYYVPNKKMGLRIDYKGYGLATEELLKRIKIDIVSKKSNAIFLTINDVNKEKGKDIINSIIANYNDYGIKEKNYEAERTGKFLQQRINLMDTELKSIERSVEKYKEENHLTNIEAEAEIILNKSSDFKEQLIKTETEFSVISMIEEFLKAPENRYAVVPMSLGIDEKSAVESLLTYNELLLERLKLLRSTKPGNPAIEAINEQVDATRLSVLVTIQSIKRGIEYARNDLRMQEQTFMNRIKGMPQQEREYIEIKRQQEIKQALFIYLLQQQEENALKLAVSNNKAQIIDHAFALNKPVSPQKYVILFLAVFFSLIAPIVFIYLRRLFAQQFHDASEMKAMSGIKPGNIIHRSEDDNVFTNPTNSVMEDIRSLRSNVYHMLHEEIDGKAIFVSSMQRNEGKTFIAMNLALSIAKTGKKVLLIDADLRHSADKSAWGISPSSDGLYQVIYNNSPVAQVIKCSASNENLFVLNAGKQGDANASETLLNVRFSQLLEDLKKNFDLILFDTSALTLYSDAMPIIKYTDAQIFVTRTETTQKESLNYIESLIEDYQLTNSICIINDVTE